MVHDFSSYTFAQPQRTRGVPEVTKDNDKLAAQGNSNPKANFSSHTLVRLYGVTYDPSYGTTYTPKDPNDPLPDFIKQSVAGYYFKNAAYQNGVGRWVIRKASTMSSKALQNNWLSIGESKLGI
jgi:hypothetical protein